VTSIFLGLLFLAVFTVGLYWLARIDDKARISAGLYIVLMFWGWALNLACFGLGVVYLISGILEL